MREPRIVTLELAAVVAELGDSPTTDSDTDRLRGALAALEWATGQRSETPVSRRVLDGTDPQAIYSENEWAYEVVAGLRPEPWPVSRAYAGGAEEALAWLRGSDSAPVPTAEISEVSNVAPSLVPKSDVEGLYEAVRLEQLAPPQHYDETDLAVLRGLVDSLEWILGKREACPVLESAEPASAETVAAANAAIDAACDAAPDGSEERFYAYGVSQVLGWASGNSTELPSVY